MSPGRLLQKAAPASFDLSDVQNGRENCVYCREKYEKKKSKKTKAEPMLRMGISQKKKHREPVFFSRKYMLRV
jgi:hypothetical protein